MFLWLQQTYVIFSLDFITQMSFQTNEQTNRTGSYIEPFQIKVNKPYLAKYKLC